jgi:23S rRNA (adenine2503-C2)-methyltransferase
VEKDLKSKTVVQIERLVTGLGQPRYIAGYIFSEIQTRGATDISAITTLSKSFRAKLVEEGYYISQLKVADKLTDPDGTIKYVFELPDESRIESVLLFDDDRQTLCVSTQVGCAMGCVFCATGRLGLTRNLTAGEIVDQANLVARDSSPVPRDTGAGSRVANVVFMGMGEPLANYDAVLDAVRILNNSAGRNIGIRHLTISTCGLVEGIERLADEDIQPRLAISLNAPTDAIRQKLMPIAKKYPLDRLFAAIGCYQRATRNRVTFEYCLIKGVNDTGLHAQMLAKRLRGIMCNVNLIEYNPPEPLPKGTPHGGGVQGGSEPHAVHCGLKASGRQAIERFAGVLKDAGIETTIRLKMGQTINAACGQLGSKRTEKSE